MLDVMVAYMYICMKCAKSEYDTLPCRSVLTAAVQPTHCKLVWCIPCAECHAAFSALLVMGVLELPASVMGLMNTQRATRVLIKGLAKVLGASNGIAVNTMYTCMRAGVSGSARARDIHFHTPQSNRYGSVLWVSIPLGSRSADMLSPVSSPHSFSSAVGLSTVSSITSNQLSHPHPSCEWLARFKAGDRFKMCFPLIVL